MATIVRQTLPEGVSLELLDAVTEEMGVDGDPPKGMIVHTHYAEGGRVHIFDVWETADDYRQFAQSRLGPAMAKVAASHDMPAPTPPSDGGDNLLEVHRVVRGK